MPYVRLSTNYQLQIAGQTFFSGVVHAERVAGLTRADATRTLTERDKSALLKVTGEHRAAFRDHLLYAMALGTGLREHELIALSIGDVFREGRPRSSLLLSVFKGAGKAGGTQEVRGAGACSPPNQWIAFQEERGKSREAAGCVFDSKYTARRLRSSSTLSPV
jgi:site-specific recombinase XerC